MKQKVHSWQRVKRAIKRIWSSGSFIGTLIMFVFLVKNLIIFDSGKALTFAILTLFFGLIAFFVSYCLTPGYTEQNESTRP